MKGRRLEGLVAPLLLILVVGFVAVVLARQESSAPEATGRLQQAPSGTPSTTAPSLGPTPAPTPTGSPSPRRRKPSAVPPLASDLPSVSCAPSPVTQEVTVLTYNIKFGLRRGGFAAIADEVEAWGADIVLLQEVDRWRARSGRSDQPAVLAERLGMSWTFGGNVQRSGRTESGTALLSRFPIIEESNTPLPNERGGEPRGALQARIDLDGLPVTVFNTHLQNGKQAKGLRSRQASVIRSLVDATPTPVLVGGDFNSGPNSAAMRSVVGGRMRDSWRDVGSGPGHTVPAGRARARIDYLIHSEEFEPVAAQVIRGRSDHRAVRATYRVVTGDTCLPPGSVN